MNIKINVAIFLVWLFHVSAIVGMSIGFEDWFIQKTPLNLLVSALLFFIIYPIDSFKKAGYFALFFFIGMLVEWLGVNYSLLFGSYEYGENLGAKIDGVPLFIGVYWALLTFITAEIALIFAKKTWLRLLWGALLMVILDYFMEQCAPKFDFWSFGEHVPLSNYLTWFIVAFLLHVIFMRSKISGNQKISLHLYMVQILFFVYFTLFLD